MPIPLARGALRVTGERASGHRFGRLDCPVLAGNLECSHRSTSSQSPRPDRPFSFSRPVTRDRKGPGDLERPFRGGHSGQIYEGGSDACRKGNRECSHSTPMHMTRLCTGDLAWAAPALAAMRHSGRRGLRIVTAFAGTAAASLAPCSGLSWCPALPAVRVPSPSSPGRPRRIGGSLSCSRGPATGRSR